MSAVSAVSPFAPKDLLQLRVVPEQGLQHLPNLETEIRRKEQSLDALLQAMAEKAAELYRARYSGPAGTKEGQR